MVVYHGIIEFDNPILVGGTTYFLSSTQGALTDDPDTDLSIGHFRKAMMIAFDTQVGLVLDRSPFEIIAADTTGTKTTKLSIISEAIPGTVFDVAASGTEWTHSKDTGGLLSTAALFNNEERIIIDVNGVHQEKGLDAIWQSSSTFTLNITLDTGDKIIITS